jgi:hypothetical protein
MTEFGGSFFRHEYGRLVGVPPPQMLKGAVGVFRPKQRWR